VPECRHDQKPCYYKPSGMNSGSYIRVGNTNRQMTAYEIFSYVSNRSQPTFDGEAVSEADVHALDRERLGGYLERLRQSRASLWQRLHLDEMPFEERLCTLRLLARVKGAFHPTLASLLCFGVWPQMFMPSLCITFVRYPGTTADEKGPRSERFLDTAKFEGHVAEIVEQAVARVRANMRQSLVVEGIFHRPLLEYPEEAVREAIVNAVAHRDYSPMARSSPIRVEMFADRLVVKSPGGLYGPVNEHNLEEAHSTRNQLLMRLLEDFGIAEDRGSGIRAMIAAMRRSRLEPPRFRDTRDRFEVTFKNTSLLDPEAVQWLNRFGGYPLSDNQRMALVYLRYNERMTNSDYRRLNNVPDTTHATRELRELVESGLVQMHETRRWAHYTLSPEAALAGLRPALGAEESAVLSYVREHGHITRSECVALLEAKPAHVSYLLTRMREQGLLKAVGRRRWTRYVLP